MNWIGWLELSLRIAGAAAALLTLGSLLIGIARGFRVPKGASLGAADRWLRAPALIMIAIGYFGACILLWRPIPLLLTPVQQLSALAAGASMLSMGLAAILWARHTLGAMYNVSSSTSVRLFAGHRLVTGGPYAIVRHPMYFGLMLAGLGGLLLYRTWGMLFLLTTFLIVALRARREEQILATAFGDQWQTYCREVPAYFPRFKRRTAGDDHRIRKKR